jgi:DNA-binding response OmpR family regulator
MLKSEILMKLLIVEDEARMADLLRRGLNGGRSHGDLCVGRRGRPGAGDASYEFDVIVLDVS